MHANYYSSHGHGAAVRCKAKMPSNKLVDGLDSTRPAHQYKYGLARFLFSAKCYTLEAPHHTRPLGGGKKHCKCHLPDEKITFLASFTLSFMSSRRALPVLKFHFFS